MNIKQMFSVIGIVLVLSGCAMMPKYTRPESPVPASLPGAAGGDVWSSEEARSVVNIRWRDVFPDEKLQNIIELSLMSNRDLRLAALNVERARAYYGVQRAELFPSVSASGSVSKQRVAEDFSTTGNAKEVEQYTINLGIAAWEIDLFGRIRSLKEQALQEYLGTEQAQRGAQTALIGEVARVYLTLAADRENFKLAQATFKTQQSIYEMIRQQFDNGIASELDLRRSQNQVEVIKGRIIYYTQLVEQDRNALNLLAGFPVPEGLLPSDLASVNPLRDISPNLSSDVLLRRPDIMAAEYQLKAAYALIGAARAAFFPRISLTTMIGTASNELSDLFNSGSRTWSFIPQASLPVFDLRTGAAYKVSKAAREISLARYEKVIQTAFREVSDALVVRGTIDRQIAAQESVVVSAQKIYELSEQRYAQGVDGYLSVLDVQRSLYAAQQELTSLRLAKLINQVRFYAVLGGDGELYVPRE